MFVRGSPIPTSTGGALPLQGEPSLYRGSPPSTRGALLGEWVLNILWRTDGVLGSREKAQLALATEPYIPRRPDTCAVRLYVVQIGDE